MTATAVRASARVHRRVVPRPLRPVIAAAVALGGWQVAVTVRDIPPFFLPSPTAIASAVAARPAYLVEQSAVTAGHTLAGLVVAAAAGIAVAVVLAASPWLRDAGLPLLVAIQAVPKVALAPLLLIWFGFGHAPKIALAALLCYFPIVISTLTGLTSTPAELVEMARANTASGWHTFVKIRARWAAPQMIAGFKIAASLALIGAVVAEMANPDAGLGAVVVRSTQVGNTVAAFAAIWCLAAIGVSLFYALVAAERLLLPWARAVTA